MTRKEILQHATTEGVPPDTIDKDWVLGHFLHILFSFRWAQDNLVFKGGTCLRKCYFEKYRFSEDIDLTVTNSDFTLTMNHLNQVCEALKDQSDIPNRIMKYDDVLHKDRHVGWDVEICYWGSNHNPNDEPVFRNVCHTKIIVEARHFEKIIFPLSVNTLLHPYSDHENIKAELPCYSIEEILSEKLRAILQRNRGEARDFFDIWYIANHYTEAIDWHSVKEAFFEKCKYKSISFLSVGDFFIPKRMKQVAITWENRLAHQMKLPVNKDIVLTELKEFLDLHFSR